MQFARTGSTLVVALFISVSAYAAEDTQFAEITIDVPTIKREDPLAAGRLGSGDTAKLLSDQPGVSLNTGGGMSSLPAIHGMADDRIKQLVDGMPITSACANHMNPAMSYAAPTNVASVGVIAGLTPVSMGGDSIAGTISVKSPAPVFSTTGKTLASGSLSGFYRSINHGSTVAAQANVASDSTSLSYSGSVDRASSYKDGHGNLVRDTLYRAENQQLTYAAKGQESQLVVKAGLQNIPYQGFVNQRMDMVGNRGKSLNADYQSNYSWGKLDARVYWQDTRHEMGFFTPEKTGMMPMNTHGRDIGYALKAEVSLSQQDTLRIGNEFHRFRLDDWWPPVTGSPMMSPNTYLNINNGRRDVFSLYAEEESKWDARWNSVLGLRGESVGMDTGDVQGYGCAMAPCVADTNAAVAFNAVSHARRDSNYDLSALARYEADQTSSYEFGYARKTRSPNLYERYAWGVSQMAMNMTGWFGDVNGYVGNLNLKPEVANTLSATARLHEAGQKDWEIAVTPYYTYVQNYIGVNLLGTYVSGGSTFSNFQFVNHDAKIYGLDVSGKTKIWDNSYGEGQLKIVAGWTRGTRTDTGGSLYHIMPFNVRTTLKQSLKSWTNALEMQYVAGKTHVDTLRNEPVTPGYTLVNLHSSYEMKNLRFDFGIDNLFNKFYYLPLGGVDYADWKANGLAGQIAPLAGPGRSVNAGMTVKF
jgi:iron complex outermembrane receptor protein